MPESPSDDGALVQSLLRGLDLLRRLAPADEGLTLREAAEAMGLKQPTAYKLLQTLVAAGFVEKTARPVHYTLGAGVLDLANQYAQRALLRRAEVTLTRLFAEFREYSANVVLTEAPAGEVEVVLRLNHGVATLPSHNGPLEGTVRVGHEGLQVSLVPPGAHSSAGSSAPRAPAMCEMPSASESRIWRMV